MLKEKKALFIMSIILIVGCGAFLTYRYENERGTTVKIQDYVAPVYHLEEVVGIEYKDKETVKLDKKEGIWTNLVLPHLKYNQELVNGWTEALKCIETKEIIKNIHDETVYGINESSVKMTLYDEQGQGQTIQVGDIIEAEDSIYLKVNEVENIYVISYEKIKELLINPNHFVDCSDVLQIPEIQEFTIQNKDKKIQITQLDQWLLKDYFELTCILDDQMVNELVDRLHQLKVENYVGTYDELEKYGLATPQFVITINNQLKIAFGKQSNEKVYVTINDGDDVYTMEQATYKKIADFNAYDAIHKQVIHLNQEEVSEIILSNPQGTYHFMLNQEVPSNNMQQDDHNSTQKVETELEEETTHLNHNDQQEGMLNKDHEMIVAKINDVLLNQVQADEWFDKMQESLWIEAPLQNPNIEQKEERKAEAQMCYILKDGSKIEIELIPYDINYYILRYNGVIEFAVNKERITKIFNELTNLVKLQSSVENL